MKTVYVLSAFNDGELKEAPLFIGSNLESCVKYIEDYDCKEFVQGSATFIEPITGQYKPLWCNKAFRVSFKGKKFSFDYLVREMEVDQVEYRA